MAALVNAYMELDDFKDQMRDQLTAHDHEYIRAINAASREIDSYCGRYFYKTATATAKTYRTDTIDLLYTADIATTTGLVVKTDDNGDGVYETTWTLGTDFILGPEDRMDGQMPYEYIEALPAKAFPVEGINVVTPVISLNSYRRKSRAKRIQVTAFWGFAAVPDDVQMACAIAATDHFKSKDLTNIAATYAAGVRLANDATPGNFGRSVKFNRVRAPSLNPEAEALISHYRKTVIA